MMHPDQWSFRPPAQHVYRAFDAHGALLYVGCTGNVKTRMVQHRSTSPWFAEMDRLEVETFATLFEAVLAEARAIISEAPIHNVVRCGAYGSADNPITPEPTRFELVSPWFARSVAAQQLDGRSMVAAGNCAGSTPIERTEGGVS